MGADWVVQYRNLWQELGVDMETADLLAADLELYWDGEVLWILEGAFADGDIIDAISFALMAVWRFKTFT